MSSDPDITYYEAYDCPGVAYHGDDDAFALSIQTRDGGTLSIRLHRQLAETVVSQITSAIEAYAPKTPDVIEAHDEVIAPREE